MLYFLHAQRHADITLNVARTQTYLIPKQIKTKQTVRTKVRTTKHQYRIESIDSYISYIYIERESVYLCAHSVRDLILLVSSEIGGRP